MSFQDQKNPGNVAGGYKATLNNPRISDSTKEEAEQRLHEMGVDPSSRANGSDRGDPDEIAEGATKQQLGGYKATIASEFFVGGILLISKVADILFFLRPPSLRRR